MTTPPPDGYETHLDAAVAFYVGAFDGCGKHLPPTAAAARAELAALREEAQLGRALYDALTEDSTRWVRTDGEENKLAVAVANARRHYE